MLANQFQLMIHYSLIHFLWSHFQVIIMKQESADTLLSGWSKLAFGFAVFRANLYSERRSSPLDFRFYYCHNLLTLNLLQMGVSSLKLNAPAIAFFENEILAFYNALSHWSSNFPFWKWKENKSRKVKCSVAVMGPLLGTNLNKLFLFVLGITMKIQISSTHICLFSGWSIFWNSHIQN